MYGVRTLADVPGLSTPSAAAGRSACLNELAYASPLLRAHGTHNRDYERGYSAGHSRGFRVGKQSCDDGPVVRPPDFGDYQRGYRKGEKEGYEAGPSPPPQLHSLPILQRLTLVPLNCCKRTLPLAETTGFTTCHE